MLILNKKNCGAQRLRQELQWWGRSRCKATAIIANDRDTVKIVHALRCICNWIQRLTNGERAMVMNVRLWSISRYRSPEKVNLQTERYRYGFWHRPIAATLLTKFDVTPSVSLIRKEQFKHFAERLSLSTSASYSVNPKRTRVGGLRLRPLRLNWSKGPGSSMSESNDDV